MSEAETTAFFKDRHVIITGGGRGIGRAVAHDFASAGAFVHVVSQSETAKSVANEILVKNGKAEAHVGSVADESFCRGVIEAVERNGDSIDILVNAAAILGPTGRFSDCSMAEFATVLSTNLMGTCNFMRWTLPAMERRGFGRIINFAGGGAAYGYPMFTPYGVSKVAIVRLTETVAEEITTPNITVNVIAPGAVATDMLAEVRRRGGEVRTVVDMEEPLRLIRYLSGPQAAHITGRFIHARDNYKEPELYKNKNMFKLRRMEIR